MVFVFEGIAGPKDMGSPSEMVHPRLTMYRGVVTAHFRAPKFTYFILFFQHVNNN